MGGDRGNERQRAERRRRNSEERGDERLDSNPDRCVRELDLAIEMPSFRDEIGGDERLRPRSQADMEGQRNLDRDRRGNRDRLESPVEPRIYLSPARERSPRSGG